MLSAVVFCFKIAESILTHCACDSILQSVVRCEWRSLTMPALSEMPENQHGLVVVADRGGVIMCRPLCLRHNYNYHFHPGGSLPDALSVC